MLELCLRREWRSRRACSGAWPRYVRSVLIGAAPGRAAGACAVGPARCPFPEEMEAAARRPRERQERGQEQDDGGQVLSPSLSGQSYWLDLWLFILFDLALFLLIYLLP